VNTRTSSTLKGPWHCAPTEEPDLMPCTHSLACGSKAQNSFERLDAIATTRLMPLKAITACATRWKFLSHWCEIRHRRGDMNGP